MKTGRVRKRKEPAPDTKSARDTKPGPEATSSPSTARPSDAKPRRVLGATPRKAPSSLLFLGIFAAIVVCIVILVILTVSRGGTDEWIEATRSDGTWTTTVTLLGPQVAAQERWESECVSDPDGAVHPGTCVSKDTDTYHDEVIEDYEEYAYNIYYEEMWDRIYQAQGTEFVATNLGRDDYWEGNLHHVREEELDRDGCAYTEYTVWVNDRQDSTQQVEVYLAECEVWDHVTVSERVYDQGQWCRCDVTTLETLGREVNQGSSTNVLWPQPQVPPGGDAERSFRGTVTFRADGYTYTTTTEDLDQYMDYLANQYYLGLRGGEAVAVRKNPP
jgi:hypothetical protein